MTPADCLRRAADTVDALAIGENKSAALILLARYIERCVLGTATEDEAAELLNLLRVL